MLENQSTRRLKWLLWLMLVWVATILGRLAFLQVFRHDELLRMALSQQQHMVAIEALRGTIFDRSGQPLAKTLPAESIVVNPMKIPDVSVAADILARLRRGSQGALHSYSVREISQKRISVGETKSFR